VEGCTDGSQVIDIHPTVFLSSVVAAASPLVLAALGETLTEKAGVINLSLDGAILLAAMAAFVASFSSGSLAVGFASGAAVGAAVACVVGVAGIHLRLPQVAVGFVLTLLCRDLAYFLGNPFSRLPGPQVLPRPLPVLGDIPFLGPIFFRQDSVVYGSFALVATSWWFLYRTRPGLELRAVGEHPAAAFARGIRPEKLQMIYLLIGGALVGLGGAAFSLGTKPGWGRPQGAEGMGWIALALVIFGGWHPVKVAAGAYFFSFLQMVGIPLQSYFSSVPTQVFQVAPFPLMIFTLLLIHLAESEAIGRWAEGRPRAARWLRLVRSAAPRGLGRPFRRE
jgi:ABC-type uncharacterized transport system permease subunit